MSTLFIFIWYQKKNIFYIFFFLLYENTFFACEWTEKWMNDIWEHIKILFSYYCERFSSIRNSFRRQKAGEEIMCYHYCVYLRFFVWKIIYGDEMERSIFKRMFSNSFCLWSGPHLFDVILGHFWCWSIALKQSPLRMHRLDAPNFPKTKNTS